MNSVFSFNKSWPTYIYIFHFWVLVSALKIFLAFARKIMALPESMASQLYVYYDRRSSNPEHKKNCDLIRFRICVTTKLHQRLAQSKDLTAKQSCPSRKPVAAVESLDFWKRVGSGQVRSGQVRSLIQLGRRHCRVGSGYPTQPDLQKVLPDMSRVDKLYTLDMSAPKCGSGRVGLLCGSG